MRMATPGQARLSLVHASPCPRLMRGLPGTTNCCCEHAFQHRFLGWPCRAHQHRRSGRRWQAVELIVERAAALDIGKDEVVACIRVPDPAGGDRGRRRRRQEIRTYPTFTASLEALADWLQTEGI